MLPRNASPCLLGTPAVLRPLQLIVLGLHSSSSPYMLGMLRALSWGSPSHPDAEDTPRGPQVPAAAPLSPGRAANTAPPSFLLDPSWHLRPLGPPGSWPSSSSLPMGRLAVLPQKAGGCPGIFSNPTARPPSDPQPASRSTSMPLFWPLQGVFNLPLPHWACTVSTGSE